MKQKIQFTKIKFSNTLPLMFSGPKIRPEFSMASLEIVKFSFIFSAKAPLSINLGQAMHFLIIFFKNFNLQISRIHLFLILRFEIAKTPRTRNILKH